MPAALFQSSGGDDPPAPPRTSTGGVTVDPAFPAGQREQVAALVALAEAADGFSALNEAAVLALRNDAPGIVHLTARAEDRVLGYAQAIAGPRSRPGFLVVHPQHRRGGLGVRLATALAEQAGPVQLLAPTDTPAAQSLAARLGLVAVRTLLNMARDLDDALPEPSVPAGVTIRTFRPGEDEAAWLAVNAAAFAAHPEQGAVTGDDLAERMAESWFDPAGLFVAERSGVMLGFHWTKQHPGRQGEVYVLGVSPAGHRQGIGRSLLLAGLHHLRDRGNTAVELYVEADSAAAVELYRRYGFTTVARDVMYAQRPTRAAQES